MIGWIDRWLDSRSDPEAIFHSALGLALVAFLHYETDPELGFAIFYVIPVFALTWRMGWAAGMVMSCACTLTRAAVEITGRPDLPIGHAGWNAFSGFLLFVSVMFVVTRIKFGVTRLRETTVELQKALGEVKRLTGLLRVCAWCRRVRTDAGEWVQMEVYMKDHADIDVTHGICPECVSEHYPGHAHGGRSAG
ncbi:MAG TPA: hypothetical protein VML00_03610 [Bacteroidota bacterium]|nr:hypothetical protein [Bacteroidota bacterium]